MPFDIFPFGLPPGVPFRVLPYPILRRLSIISHRCTAPPSAQVEALLACTLKAAADGKYELFKRYGSSTCAASSLDYAGLTQQT